METFDQTYAGFPKGSWWVRWIDHIAVLGQMRILHLTLAAWPAESVAPGAVLGLPGNVATARISVSLLGHFAVGDVLHNGRLARSKRYPGCVMSICERLHGAQATKTFVVDLKRGDLGKRTVSSDFPEAKSPSWSENKMPKVLARSRYADLPSRNFLCRAFESGRDHVLVPPSEILRAFVLTHPRIAHAVFSAPLEAALDLLAVRPSLPPQREGWFRVDLRPGVPHEAAPYIANLMPERVGGCFAEASRLWDCLYHPDPEAQHNGAITKNAACLPAIMPFSGGTLRFTARCFKVNVNHFLVGRIVSFESPQQGPVESSHPEGLHAEDHMVVANPRPDNRPNMGYVVNPLDDSGPGDELTPLPVEAPTASGAAEVRRVTRPRPAPIEPNGFQEGAGEIQVVNEVGLGETNPDSSIAPGSQKPMFQFGEQNHERCPRFDAVLNLFDHHQGTGVIASYEVLPSGTRPGKRGHWAVWHVSVEAVVDDQAPNRKRPSLRSWTWIREEPSRPRAIMVCRLNLVSGVVLHWFEVEGTGSQSYNALIVRFAAPAPSIETVIETITAQRGRVDVDMPFAKAHGASDAISFTHHFGGKEHEISVGHAGRTLNRAWR